ncbi:MAG: ECF transporter S component [Lachnospiraceae bacterium]|nr:ECF transporter S component [Lachnospiraceae bacterium]
MKRFTVKTITTGAMLVALGVIFSFLRIPLTNITEITLTGIPVAVGGFFFGPIVAAVIGALIDVLGFFVHPGRGVLSGIYDQHGRDGCDLRWFSVAEMVDEGRWTGYPV